MEQMRANYYHKIHSAWLRHCAEIVEPCSKDLSELIEYLTENYDVEPMSQGELEAVQEHFVQDIEADRYSDLADKYVNKLELSARDIVFTLAALHDSQEALKYVERINRASLSLQGYRILLTERNKQRLCKYITYTHKNIDGMYKGYECGYVFWDESLQYFSSEGYGSLEIMDDLRIYHGVSQTDIENLTYRFSRFVQLFPHSTYPLSFDVFSKDMDMCRKYGFYNNQRLFTEMLRNNKTQHEFFDKHMADAYKKRWYESFVPPSLYQYADEHYYFNKDGISGFLWHVFSYGDMDCLKGQYAISAFNSQQKDECIIFFSDEEYACKIKNAANLSAEILNEFSEVFITNDKFTWTYIHTHESNCGPYFYKKGAEHEKELIRGMMKRPSLYVDAYRLDYLRHFLTGLDFPVDKSCFYEDSWAIEYDLEKWLFINESVSIRNASSINGWSPFFRTFGVRGLAINAFNYFLCDDLLTERHPDLLKDTPAWKIYGVNSHLKDRRPYKQCKNSGQYDSPKFSQLLIIVNSMIEDYVEKIKVYLHYDDYFMQIRFYFKRDGCWIDGNSLKSQDGYYDKLTALHACAELVFEKEYLYKSITIDYHKGKIDFSIQLSYSSEYSWKEIVEPDRYKDEDCYFNMLYKWKGILSKKTLDLEEYSNAVDSIDWKEFDGSEYYNPDRLSKALKTLAAIDTADLNQSISIEFGHIPNLLQNNKVCNEVLFAVGNNHAGTYYPATVKAIEFIIQVAINGNNGISRNCALNILIDLFHFWPELGDYKENSADEIKAIVNTKILGIKPQLLLLAVRDSENKAVILDLIESLNENSQN